MSKISPAKFALRHEVVRYAVAHGNHAAARHYECSRNTVKLWRKRWEAGDDSFADHSRRPHHSPRRTCAKVAAQVVAARQRAPCFGARRLVDAFELPVGKGAAHRIVRDAGLIRPRPRKHRRKADLRAIKAAHPPLRRLQMDTKYLNDIPAYWPQMQGRGLPGFQYTIRDESTGALFLAYASALSKTYATLAIARVLHHLRSHGVDLTEVEVRTDLGTEFDGDTVHYRADGFHGTITGLGARHRFNPPARPNANADVESSHATIEHEFFDLESFADTHAFIAAATTYQHFFNFARKNRSRSNLSPADLLSLRAPKLHPKILLLPPVFLDPLLGQDLSGPPGFGPEAGGSVRRRRAKTRREALPQQAPGWP
jgi:transposase